MKNVIVIQQNLKNKYGDQALHDFNLLGTKHFWTLSDIAKKYGFSRERARQLYNKLFGVSYKQIKRQLKEDRDSQLNDRICLFHPGYKVASYKEGSVKVGAEAELMVFNKCKQIGFSVKIPETKQYDLIINSYRVDVKSANVALPGNSRCHIGYFRFVIRGQQLDVCEFFVCYIIPQKTFYVIPRSRLKSKIIYIREKDNYQHPTMPWLTKNNTNYREYKEAWHLLKENKKQEEIK